MAGQDRRVMKGGWAAAALLALAGWLAPVAVATPFAPKTTEAPPPPVLDKVGVEQRLDAPLPLDARFFDEAGREIALGDVIGVKDRPVVLAMVYYECPMLCTMTLNGMSRAFKVLDFDIGDEYDVVTISFNPRETPELARKKKENYLRVYGRVGAESGWHFLTGPQASIDRVTEAVGFNYAWDENSEQYAHSAAIMVVTPEGRVSRYFYGLEYSARDLRLGLVEASEGRIGTLADAVKLLCYAYDPTTGKYGFVVMTALRAGGVATVLGIGTFAFVAIRRERRRSRLPELKGGPVDE